MSKTNSQGDANGGGSAGDAPKARLMEVILDESSIGRTSSDVEHERRIAIFDLIEANYFELHTGHPGPYRLTLAIAEKRLLFDLRDETGQPAAAFMLSLSPFRPIVKDYFLVCESYYTAIKTSPPARIEALDMGRRSLHDEGSQLLMERLQGKIKTDFDTARRLFTLLCALHWKG
jgi:uncharacterized protein (UPF0262 family)